MKKKILMKISTVAMVFLVGVGFVGNTVSMSASSVEIDPTFNEGLYNELLNRGEVSVRNNGRAFISTALLISALKYLGGTAAVTWVGLAVANGTNQFCIQFRHTHWLPGAACTVVGMG